MSTDIGYTVLTTRCLSLQLKTDQINKTDRSTSKKDPWMRTGCFEI